jgi:hypothetical protein
MLLLNFAYPLTQAQIAAIEEKLSRKIDRVIHMSVFFDNQVSFIVQAEAIFKRDEIPWDLLMTTPVLVNLPSHNLIAAMILTVLHGHLGHFPAVIRLRPIENVVPTEYEVAEIIDLQQVRDVYRKQRFNPSSNSD